MSKKQIAILVVLSTFAALSLITLLVFAGAAQQRAGLEDTQRALAPAMTLIQNMSNFDATLTMARLTQTADALTETQEFYPTLTAMVATATAYTYQSSATWASLNQEGSAIADTSTAIWGTVYKGWELP